MNRNIFILAIIIIETHSILPPTFKTCDRNQKDFSECFKTAVQEAVSQSTSYLKNLQVQQLDPLEIDSMVIETGSGPVRFDQKYQNVKIYGFSQCKFTQAALNFDDNRMTASLICPEVREEADYDFEGKLLGVPFLGKGGIVINTVQLHSNLSFKFEEYTKNGTLYLRVVETKFEAKPENVTFQFENIKSDNINITQLFNDNWEAIYDDVGAKYENFLGKIFEKMFNQILENVSIEELFGKKNL